MTDTAYPYIETDATASPIILSTTTKVYSKSSGPRLLNHWGDPRDTRQYPSLGLAQIHSAMSVYSTISRTDREIAKFESKNERIQIRERKSENCPVSHEISESKNGSFRSTGPATSKAANHCLQNRLTQKISRSVSASIVTVLRFVIDAGGIRVTPFGDHVALRGSPSRGCRRCRLLISIWRWGAE